MKYTTVERCQEYKAWGVVAWTVEAAEALRKIGYGDILKNERVVFPFPEQYTALRVSKEINELLEKGND